MTAEPITTEEEAPAVLRGGTPRHLAPVGPLPEAAAFLLCSLMWAPPDLVTTVAEYIDPAVDLGTVPAAAFDVIVGLARQGQPASPILVVDELRRRGQHDRLMAPWLNSATVAGAPPESARHYAAAVVAQSLRRHVEIIGNALTSASETAAESEIHHLVITGAQRIQTIIDRLSALRGEEID